MAKKNNNRLSGMDQVDGKVAGGGVFRTLDALIGEGSCSPYPTLDENEYSSYLGGLNSTDLDRHAQKVGLAPTFERRVLKERLMREFKKFVASASKIEESVANSHMLNDTSASNLTKEAQKILSEGR
jgi:hypothetical protein